MSQIYLLCLIYKQVMKGCERTAMKRKMMISGLLSAIILLSACGKVLPQTGENISTEVEEMEYVNLTPEQEELLSKISVNEEKVKEGELSSWQLEVLRQYEYLLEYLKEKYPSYDFSVEHCTPKNKLNSYTTFLFTEKNNPEKYYDCYLYVENGYHAEDNFYGHLIEEEYGNMIYEFLKENGISVERVKTSITNVQGKDYCEEMNLEAAFEGKMRLTQNSEIYVRGTADDNNMELCNQIEHAIKEKNIYGSYTVNVYDENGKILYDELFNTF